MNELIAWYAPGLPPGEQESAEDRRSREAGYSEVEAALRDLGMKTAISEDVEELRLLLSGTEPVLLLAELCDPGGWPGWSVVADIRNHGGILPVMVLSAASEEQQGAAAVSAFDAGGNEYMSLPVHTGEFKCRVLNLLKLTGRRRGLASLLKVDGLILDPSRRQVSRDGNELKMTPKEFDLLYYLAVNLGEICSRSEILKQVWGYQFHADTNVVDVYIRHIRMKVDKGHRNKLIHTIRGTGYVLRAPENGANC
ncbi:response regulator transcription factor [Paenibacillus sp. MMS20-IR301]|uniref:response regulator transcription factor n=1 Tax=Paenibacillus sp. MMS20-IR301 TaxID=2895946 RepID=UPI0028E6D12F|nr:response regulator transcription factor [Paenibacillus sp. MMS20-IR301]WNS44996.1 response regulator transcription factor [Paenibacillus sp. MMS20-IR301]